MKPTKRFLLYSNKVPLNSFMAVYLIDDFLHGTVYAQCKIPNQYYIISDSATQTYGLSSSEDEVLLSNRNGLVYSALLAKVLRVIKMVKCEPLKNGP